MKPGLHRFNHEAMATRFELIIAHEDQLIANGAAQAVFADFDRLENELSRFIPYSDIARINAAAAGEPVHVDAACLDCLGYGQEIWRETGGAFDVTVGPLYAVLRHPDGHPRKPVKQDFESAKTRVGYHLLHIDQENAVVTPQVSGMGIDLGAIGKGYALDQALFTLKEWEIENVLLNAGESTVMGLGSYPGQDGWPVRAGEGAPFVLKNNALSGTGFMYKGAHIVDPRTARLVDTSRVLRWAIAPNATLADALSTAFMVMNKKEIAAFEKAHPEVQVVFLQ